MNAATLKALKGSIKKWEKIALGTGEDFGQNNCPLCRKFNVLKGYCDGCPVEKATGESGCLGTPYVDFFGAVRADLRDVGAHTFSGLVSDHVPIRQMVIGPKSMQVAIDECNFLVSLLPKGER